ncbi:unnamed protein product [marine sediment metagenome]|uniref:Uncharacterized protein n=1 Tax=marine sediment metagenome TaxID=412755 RepID=X1UKJ5_9ZZZZ
MRLGFNIAIVCIVTVLCVTALLIVAVANGHNSALITGGCATLVGIPTAILTFFATKAKYETKQ